MRQPAARVVYNLGLSYSSALACEQILGPALKAAYNPLVQKFVSLSGSSEEKSVTERPDDDFPHIVKDALSTFDGLGIAPKILEFLDKIKFDTPTPIQHKAIPAGIAGQDIIGIARTGTGKTLAFAIPMVQHLVHKTESTGLVLVPTRELAVQVEEEVQKLCHLFKIRSAVLIGGAPMGKQLQQLEKKPRIIIATPGRLIDHVEQKTVSLKEVRILVLDEADRMLDMGFLPQIQTILRHVPKDRQTMLFSATMPQEIVRIASLHMKLPVQVEIAPPGATAERVTQELFIVTEENKKNLLVKLLDQYRGSVLVFSRTRIGAQKITRVLLDHGYEVAEIHSDRSLVQRQEALEGFKRGKYRVLIATDIASRGIDVTGIEAVINYDLPEEADNYVHRIGRTGRAGHTGHAISFATPDQRQEVAQIEKLTKIPIPVSNHTEVPTLQFPKGVKAFRSRTFGSLRRRR